MAVSQALPRFLTAPLLAANRVDVCPRLDCVAALHGVHVRPLVGAHQALTCPLAAASRLHSRPHLAPRAPNASGLAAMALSALPAEFDASGSLGQGWCSAHDRQRSPSFVHVNAQGSTSPASAFSAAPASPKMSMTPKDHRWVAQY